MNNEEKFWFVRQINKMKEVAQEPFKELPQDIASIKTSVLMMQTDIAETKGDINNIYGIITKNGKKVAVLETEVDNHVNNKGTCDQISRWDKSRSKTLVGVVAVSISLFALLWKVAMKYWVK